MKNITLNILLVYIAVVLLLHTCSYQLLNASTGFHPVPTDQTLYKRAIRLRKNTSRLKNQE